MKLLPPVVAPQPSDSSPKEATRNLHQISLKIWLSYDFLCLVPALSDYGCYVVFLVPSCNSVDLHIWVAVEPIVIRATVTLRLCSVHQRSHFPVPNTEAKTIFVVCPKYVAEFVTENYASAKRFWQIAGKDLTSKTSHA